MVGRVGAEALLETGSPATVRLATWAGCWQRLQASSRARSAAAAAAARRAAPVAQRHRPSARRAGRGHHAGRAGGQQRLDQGVGPRRAVRAAAGEQPRAPVQFPQHLVALERPGDRFGDHLEQPGLIQSRAEAADMGRDLPGGIGAVVGTAAAAARPAVPVPGTDLAGAPADRARLGGAAPAAIARCADPQHAIALDQPPGLTAAARTRQDQPLGPVLPQDPDQQLDLRRALRLPRGQQARIAAQRRGQPPLLSPRRRSPRDRGGDGACAQARLGAATMRRR